MRYTVRMKHVFEKNGVFYFERRIPKDLLSKDGPKKIVKSLKTSDPTVAQMRARQTASELDLRWSYERNPSIELPPPQIRDGALSLLDEMGVDPREGFTWQNEDNAYVLSDMAEDNNAFAVEAFRILKKGAIYYPSDALKLYVKMRCQNRGDRGIRDVERPIEYLLTFCGEKPIEDYKKSDANKLRDALYEKGLKSTSIKRIFESLRSVFNLAYDEYDLSHNKAFSRVALRAQPVQSRLPFSLEELRRLQAECRDIDDPNRWLISLLSDSGMRLGEAIGIIKDDVILNCRFPHLKLVERPWRRLKTKSSERVVPLAGESLWAVKRAMESSDVQFLFPKYCDERTSRANSASGALGKWLKPRTNNHQVVHSFRHTFRDRLRNVGCPFDIQEQLGGWSTPGVGSSDGQGYDLETLHYWMTMLATTSLEAPLTTYSHSVVPNVST